MGRPRRLIVAVGGFQVNIGAPVAITLLYGTATGTTR